jgi:hypothetical protein
VGLVDCSKCKSDFRSVKKVPPPLDIDCSLLGLWIVVDAPPAYSGLTSKRLYKSTLLLLNRLARLRDILPPSATTPDALSDTLFPFVVLANVWRLCCTFISRFNRSDLWNSYRTSTIESPSFFFLKKSRGLRTVRVRWGASYLLFFQVFRLDAQFLEDGATLICDCSIP